MGPVRAGLLVAVLVVTTEAWGQVSIESLRATVDSSNLELVTLQGVVHLSRPGQNELGGKCGSTREVKKLHLRGRAVVSSLKGRLHVVA